MDRQKLMAKGIWRGILKPDMALSDMKLADGVKLTLIGTSAGIPSVRAAHPGSEAKRAVRRLEPVIR